MLDTRIRERVAERLRSAQLTKIVGAEISELIKEKPRDMPTDEFCATVASMVLDELHRYLCSSPELKAPKPLPRDSDDTATPTDLGDIVKRVTESVEFALLSGNLQMVHALGGAIAQRDTGTSEHNLRVVLYAVRLAETLRQPRESTQSLIKGAFLHDVGKIGIRDDILLKAGGLTDDERRIMNSHPERGATIIGSVRWLQDALDVVKYHHEWYDGHGYPNSLSSEDIPINARIFAIGDVFDALTSARPYKGGMSFLEAVDMLREASGTQFDPSLLKIFLSIAPTLYETISAVDSDSLSAQVKETVARHFSIDLGELKW